MRIQGCSVLLTGASGGLGHAIARGLAARGARLVLTGRRADLLRPLAAELGGTTMAVDLRDSAAVERLATEQDAVDILVANAGLPGTGRLEDQDVERIDRVLDVNLRAPVVLAHRLVGAMRRRGAGHLVFMSSLSGIAASPQASLYCATKFGLRGFALALREELRGTGVGVSAVYPGPIRDAGMFADARVKLPPGTGTNSPQDVADAVVRAIERNRAEITVASPLLRAGMPLALVAPNLSAAVQRNLGGHRVAAELAQAQREKC